MSEKTWGAVAIEMSQCCSYTVRSAVRPARGEDYFSLHEDYFSFNLSGQSFSMSRVSLPRYSGHSIYPFFSKKLPSKGHRWRSFNVRCGRRPFSLRPCRFISYESISEVKDYYPCSVYPGGGLLQDTKDSLDQPLI